MLLGKLIFAAAFAGLTLSPVLVRAAAAEQAEVSASGSEKFDESPSRRKRHEPARVNEQATGQ